MKGNRGKPNEQLFPKQVVIQLRETNGSQINTMIKQR